MLNFNFSYDLWGIRKMPLPFIMTQADDLPFDILFLQVNIKRRMEYICLGRKARIIYGIVSIIHSFNR
jgi:hypothetical protein